MEALIEKVNHYRRNYSIIARAHYLSASYLESLNAWLGIPALLLSIAICTTLSLSGSEGFPQIIITIAGVASLFVALLTGLQVFIRASERSMEHRAAGARFADVRRRLELMSIKFQNNDNNNFNDCIYELENMLVELRELGALCPKIPDQYYRKAEREYKIENESDQNQK